MDLFFGINNIIFGIVMMLVGFKVYIPFKAGGDTEKQELWYKKFGTLLKFLGFFMLIFGIIIMFKGF